MAAMAKKDKLKDIEEFSNGQTWHMIQEEMNAEKYEYDEWQKRIHDSLPPATAHLSVKKALMNGQAPPMKATLAIENAIRETGMDYDNTLYSIRSYANRNEVMHSMVSVFIKNCNWDALALQMSRDIKDLPRVFGHREYEDMRQVLLSLRDRYFTNINNPSKPELTALAMER